MKSLITIVAAAALTACGIDTSKLQDQAATTHDAGSESGSASDAPEAARAPAASPATKTTVKVHTETDVEVTVGDDGENDHQQAAPVAAGQLLRFADGAFGWFFADGSFDHGAVYEHGQQAAGYCRFEAPDCEGRCVVDALPVKSSLYSNGAAYYMAAETETDNGRTVVASIWRGGHCQAEVRTLQHSYSPVRAWTLDAGDSTVPGVHQ